MKQHPHRQYKKAAKTQDKRTLKLSVRPLAQRGKSSELRASDTRTEQYCWVIFPQCLSFSQQLYYVRSSTDSHSDALRPTPIIRVDPFEPSGFTAREVPGVGACKEWRGEAPTCSDGLAEPQAI
jgi:hypothetical protein